MKVFWMMIKALAVDLNRYIQMQLSYIKMHFKIKIIPSFLTSNTFLPARKSIPLIKYSEEELSIKY